jgi:DNA polymerase-3 subunit beta
MKFNISRNSLLKCMQQVCGVIENKSPMPILSNILFVLDGSELILTGTDLEIELSVKTKVQSAGINGSITVPAKRLLEICKALPNSSELLIELFDSSLLVKSGKSKFKLNTLPSVDFPQREVLKGDFTLSINSSTLKDLIKKTAFAMAQQDVRYYLNGMLFEVTTGRLRTVSTDGHRLAMCDAVADAQNIEKLQVIVPRKGVQELSRLLTDDTGNVAITLGTNHISATLDNVTFSSKLIDGKFPDYERVIPKGGDKLVLSNREDLRNSLQRAAILSNEKFRGVRLSLTPDLLCIQATNPEQEEAEDDLTVEYSGASLEIGFNVQYLLDVLNALNSNTAKLTLGDSNSSALVQDADDGSAVYVIMPMRL